MVWTIIGYNRLSAIQFLSGKIDSSRYVQMLRDEFIDNLGAIADQQDNAAIHSAKVFKQFFQQQHTDVLDFPAREMENCWGQLNRIVYAESKQFEDVDELENAIISTWDQILRKHIRKLFNSLPKRMVEILKKKGG